MTMLDHNSDLDQLEQRASRNVTPTRQEAQLILQHSLLMEKFAWLRQHPGKTRRDYQQALRDGSLIEWRKPRNNKAIDAEQAAWEQDYPGIPYDNVTTCAAAHFPNEAALFVAWQCGRESAA